MKKNKEWDEEELETLKIFYPRSTMKIILDTLRKKTWGDCRQKASDLGIKRMVNDYEIKKGRKKKKINQSISKKKLQALLRNPDLTVEDIAKKLNSTPDVIRRNIFRYGL